jgi:DNA polymerase III delta prime subunit
MSFTTKYAPNSLQEVVISDPIVKDALDSYVCYGNMQPLLLYGLNGIGKSSIAHLLPSAMEEEQSVSSMNSLQDEFNKVSDVKKFFKQKHAFSLFAQMAGQKRSYFILDELDFNSKVAFEFRKKLDDLPSYVQFIFTTNYFESVDVGIRDRCLCLHITAATAQDWLPRIREIMQAEKVTVSNATLLKLITAQLDKSSSHRKLLEAMERYVYRVKRGQSIAIPASVAASATIISLPVDAQAMTIPTTATI